MKVVQVNLKLTADEAEALKAAAKESGKSLAKFVLWCCLENADPDAKFTIAKSEPAGPPPKVAPSSNALPPPTDAAKAFQVRPPINASGLLPPPPDAVKKPGY